MKELGKTKVFELLSIFTEKEWRQLGRLPQVVNSPHLKALYAFLDHYYPDFKSVPNDRTALFTAVFGQIPYEDKKLRYVLTDMQRAAEMHLTMLSIGSRPGEGSRILEAELARRGAGKNFISRYRNKDAEANDNDAASVSEKFFMDFRREETYLMHYLPQLKRGESNISETARSLDLFYIVKKLQLMCEMVNIRNVLQVEVVSQLDHELAAALQNGVYADVPAVSAWYNVWLTLTEPANEKHFWALHETLIRSFADFPLDELRDMFKYLMNYCIRRINTGDTAFIGTLLNIYKTLLERGIIFTDGYLSQWDYKNITAIGVRSGENEWTGTFIEQYRSKLRSQERENAYTYNRAYFLFSTGRRTEARSLLRQVEFSDLYYQLDSRVILLKCYFEDGDEDAFFYHASAFRLFLSRNKQISAYQRTVYRNLIRYSSRILQANGNPQKLAAIKSEVERVKHVADIGWILRRL